MTLEAGAKIKLTTDPAFKEKARALLALPDEARHANRLKFLNALLALYRRSWPEDTLVLELEEDRDRGDRIALGWLAQVEDKRRFLSPQNSEGEEGR